MPYFVVILHGGGIRLPSAAGDSEKSIVGFFNTKIVHAADTNAAFRAAIGKTEKEWSKGYAQINRGEKPSFEVDEIFEIDFWSYLFRKQRRGFTFYPEE